MGCLPSKPTQPSEGLGDVDAGAFDAPAPAPAAAPAAAPTPAAAPADGPEDKELEAEVKVSESAQEAIEDASHLRATLGQKVGAPSFQLAVLPFLNRECFAPGAVHEAWPVTRQPFVRFG